MNDNFIEVVMEAIQENIKLYRAMFRQQFRDLHWGMHSLTDEEHGRWFIQKAVENPNWVLALPYVDGGMAEIRRFESTMGLAPSKEPD